MAMWKNLALGCGLLAAVCACAMPTAEELKEARPLVAELMAPEMKALKTRTKTSAEVGDAACALAREAAGEAAKWLLLSGAVTSYARDGKVEQALDTLKGLRSAVKDIPDAELRDLLAAAVKAAPEGNSAPLKAAGLEADGRVRAAEGLKKAQAALKKTPKDPALHRRAGACLAVLGDWEEALKAFARADEKTAAAAKGEQRKTWAPEKAADFWWDEAASSRGAAKKAYLRHAASLYADAVGSGALAGLAKTRAERRIAEAEAAAPASGLFLAAADTAPYLVVDLSAGSEAKRYPVSHLKDVPRGGWTDAYKTTKLVLRRLEPGSYVMGDDQGNEAHRVTITKPFYMGVFEVTQRQWELVKGKRPSFWQGACWATRPVENISYNDIRGKDKGAKWPASNAVDDTSFLGLLRARTQLVFDLPTEGQWEYACRAGTTGDYNAEGGLDKLGRYRDNGGWNEAAWGRFDWRTVWQKADRACGAANGTAPVGSYLPNAWGLYDLHGNVWERCLDWKDDHRDYGTDPVGGASGGGRVNRGGGWGDDARDCRSAHRYWWSPGYAFVNGGFRLSCSAAPRE